MSDRRRSGSNTTQHNRQKKRQGVRVLLVDASLGRDLRLAALPSAPRVEHRAARHERADARVGVVAGVARRLVVDGGRAPEGRNARAACSPSGSAQASTTTTVSATVRAVCESHHPTSRACRRPALRTRRCSPAGTRAKARRCPASPPPAHGAAPAPPPPSRRSALRHPSIPGRSSACEFGCLSNGRELSR